MLQGHCKCFGQRVSSWSGNRAVVFRWSGASQPKFRLSRFLHQSIINLLPPPPNMRGMDLDRPLQSRQRRLRIGIVTETYPPEINGVALTIARWIEGLRQRDHIVQLVRVRQGVNDHPQATETLDILLFQPTSNEGQDR